MKLLIVSQYYWPEYFKITDLAEYLIEQGHSVTVFTNLPNYPEGKIFDGYGFFKRKKETHNGVKIIRNWLIPRGGGSIIRIIGNYLSALFFSAIGIFYKIGSNYDIQLVFATSPLTAALPAIINRRLRKIPLALWLLDIWPESVYAMTSIDANWFRALMLGISKFIYRRCDLILNPSQGYFSLLEKRGVRLEQMVYAPNWGEDLPIINDAKVKKTVNKYFDKRFTFLFAGNVGEAQDFPNVIKAIERAKKQNKKFQFIIVGSGARSSWLKDEIERLNLNDVIVLAGRHSVELMPAFFARADVLFLSLKDEPAFSLTVPGKLQMYMKASRPILAMLNGEGASVLKDSKAGDVVPAGDYLSLAKSILQMTKITKPQREKFGKAGQKYYMQHFERKKILASIETNLLSLVK